MNRRYHHDDTCHIFPERRIPRGAPCLGHRKPSWSLQSLPSLSVRNEIYLFREREKHLELACLSLPFFLSPIFLYFNQRQPNIRPPSHHIFLHISLPGKAKIHLSILLLADNRLCLFFSSLFHFLSKSRDKLCQQPGTLALVDRSHSV